MAKIQTVFEQYRKEQYLFSFRLFTVWAALFSSKPIECEELKARRMAEVSNKGCLRRPLLSQTSATHLISIMRGRLSRQIIEQSPIVIQYSMIGGH